MVIWKYTIGIDDVTAIELPEGSEPLSVAFQGADLVLWVRIPGLATRSDPGGKLERRRFLSVMTGPRVPDRPGNSVPRFVGTACRTGFSAASFFVIHVFELVKES